MTRTNNSYFHGNFMNQSGQIGGTGRKALNAAVRQGHYRGMNYGSVFKSNITVINNNYYSNDMHHCCNYDYGYDNYSMSKGEKWMLGLGVAGNFLGDIFGGLKDLFGALSSRKAEGAGGIETAPEAQIPAAATPPLAEVIEPQKPTTPATTPIVDNDEVATPVKPQPASPFEDGATVRVRDQKLYDRYGGENGGGITDIQGLVTNNLDGTFSIKDVKNTYTYQNTGKTVEYNGQEYPVYTLVGAVDSKTGETKSITQQSYILMDGQLYQPKDLELLGNDIGSIAQYTGTKATNNAPPPTQDPTNDGKGVKDFKPYKFKMPNGGEYTVLVSTDGKNVLYKDKDGNKLTKEEFEKQTGVPAEKALEAVDKAANKSNIGKARIIKTKTQTQSAPPPEVTQWNASHPNQQIKVDKDGTLTTTVKMKDNYGYTRTKEISGKSLQDLQNNVENFRKSIDKSVSNNAGYAGVGQAMNQTKSSNTRNTSSTTPTKQEQTQPKKYDLNSFTNELKSKGMNCKNVSRTNNGWNFHIEFPSGNYKIITLKELNSDTLASIKE